MFHRPGVVIYGFHVRAMAAGDTWGALHKHRSETGYYPVIMADIDTLSTYADQTPESPSSIMSRSESWQAV